MSAKKHQYRRASFTARKLDTGDRCVIFLVKKRHDWSYKALGYLFGVSDESASNYCAEIELSFYDHFVPRLFYFPTKVEVESYLPEAFKNAFPGMWFIVDGVHFEIDVPSNPALGQVTFCVYKWFNSVQMVIGECWSIDYHCIMLFLPFISNSLTSKSSPPIESI